MMRDFLLVAAALGFMFMAFASGVLVGFVLKIPSRIERIRRMRDEMMKEIDETVDYYVDLHERLARRQDQD